MADSDALLELAAQIVSAHVSKNAVGPDELARLISDVHRALSTAGQAAATPPRGEPAVPVRHSMRHDHLVCLECGKHFSMLKRHLANDHNITPEQYRQKWGLSPSYPIVAPDYAKIRSTLAKKIGLGRKRAAPMKVARKKTARRGLSR